MQVISFMGRINKSQSTKLFDTCIFPVLAPLAISI